MGIDSVNNNSKVDVNNVVNEINNDNKNTAIKDGRQFSVIGGGIRLAYFTFKEMLNNNNEFPSGTNSQYPNRDRLNEIAKDWKGVYPSLLIPVNAALIKEKNDLSDEELNCFEKLKKINQEYNSLESPTLEQVRKYHLDSSKVEKKLGDEFNKGDTSYGPFGSSFHNGVSVMHGHLYGITRIPEYIANDPGATMIN